MTSLARREGLAGKVQIYIDPPYGIKFSSNSGQRESRGFESGPPRHRPSGSA